MKTLKKWYIRKVREDSYDEEESPEDRKKGKTKYVYIKKDSDGIEEIILAMNEAKENYLCQNTESNNSLDDEFARSEMKLNESSGFIGKLCKERCILICFVGIAFIIGFYIIFFKKNNNAS